MPRSKSPSTRKKSRGRSRSKSASSKSKNKIRSPSREKIDTDNISHEERKEWRKTFRKASSDSSGFVDFEALCKVVDTSCTSETALTTIMAEVGLLKDDLIDFDYFCVILNKVKTSTLKESEALILPGENIKAESTDSSVTVRKLASPNQRLNAYVGTVMLVASFFIFLLVGHIAISALTNPQYRKNPVLYFQEQASKFDTELKALPLMRGMDATLGLGVEAQSKFNSVEYARKESERIKLQRKSQTAGPTKGDRTDAEAARVRGEQEEAARAKAAAEAEAARVRAEQEAAERAKAEEEAARAKAAAEAEAARVRAEQEAAARAKAEEEAGRAKAAAEAEAARVRAEQDKQEYDFDIPSLCTIYVAALRFLALWSLYLACFGQDIACFLFGMQLQSSDGIPLGLKDMVIVRLVSFIAIILGGLEVAWLIFTGKSFSQWLLRYDVVILPPLEKRA